MRRVFLPTQATESFTVIGPDLRPVELIDEYLAWLTNNERSPNTSRPTRTTCGRSGPSSTSTGSPGIRSGLWNWPSSRPGHGDRRRTSSSLPTKQRVCHRRPSTGCSPVSSASTSFRLDAAARSLRTSSCRRAAVAAVTSRSYMASLAVAREVARVRLPEQQALPKTLTLEQIAAVIDAQTRLRDRFFFALLASSGRSRSRSRWSSPAGEHGASPAGTA